MFNKPINSLSKDDILRLIEEKVPEGYGVEFKETLPSKKGNDPWIDGKGRIGDHARNQILEEIIAFANAYGGIVIIGIAESCDKPAVATKIHELPECTELAERIKLYCRDCIEPIIPLVETTGVVINDVGAGIVIINVPQSRLAPHRHVVTRECYIRREDRTEKMTMREIQDLTLNTERGMARIDNILKERKLNFDNNVKAFRKDVSHKMYGIRITIIPTTEICIEKIHEKDDIKANILRFKGTFDGSTYTDLFIAYNIGPWKPLLRGTRAEDGDKERRLAVELHSNGLIELQFFVSEHDNSFTLYSSWFMSMICNALHYLHRMRLSTDTHELEYAMEIQINNVCGSLPVQGYGGPEFRDLGYIKESNVVFPRYSIGPRDTYQLLCNLIEDDFWNHAGVPSDGINLQINFDN
jgi:hypothetical protein